MTSPYVPDDLLRSFEQHVEQQTQRALQLSNQIEQSTTTLESPGGEVRVTVDSTGGLAGLRFGGSGERLSLERLAELVLDTSAVTNPDIRLSTGEVRRHAASVEEASRMLDEALAGASHVRASNESYGQLVGPLFTSILNPVQDHAIDEIKHAVIATQSLAELLRTMASNLDLSDQQAAHRLGGR